MNQKSHRHHSPGHLKEIAQYKCMGLKRLSAYQSNTMGTEETVTASSIILTIHMAMLLNWMKSTIPWVMSLLGNDVDFAQAKFCLAKTDEASKY